MEIRINGNILNITIEHEKTVGEIMAGIEVWLANSGHRLSGLSMDGAAAGTDSLESAFSREIDTIKVLDIFTNSLSDLTVMSLASLLADIDEYSELSFDEKNIFLAGWKTKPQAQFAEEQMPDLYNDFTKTFSNEGLNVHILRSITEERLRETENPFFEFSGIRILLEETCEKLINLPLDIQTGKDVQAAQTIQMFTGITDKIIRIVRHLNNQGLLAAVNEQTEKQIPQLINEFNQAAKELLDAYEKYDTVLVGDLAEYEMAPKLHELYNVIMDNIQKPAGAE